MAYNFLPYDPHTMFLLPPSISDWVPEKNLARMISEVVDLFESEGRLAPFYGKYRSDGWGHPAFDPRMMVKVLLYAHCIGVRTSRRIAMALETDVAFRFLSANQTPDFRTISEFRRKHLEAFGNLFVESLRLCQEAGLAKMGRVALDGRKVAGNAALDQNRTKKALEEQVSKIEAEVDRLDREEDEKYGEDKRGDELPEDMTTESGRAARLRQAQAELDLADRKARAERRRLATERLARIHEAKRRLAEAERVAKEEQARKNAERQKEEEESGRKKRGRKPRSPEEAVNDEAKANMTDPDSRILKNRRGYLQGYNAQAMADCESQVIVSADVTQEENDIKQLEPMLERCLEQAGSLPAQTLADAGYCSDANLERDGRGTMLFVATTKDRKQRQAMRDRLSPRGRIPRSATRRERMERRLLTKAGRAIYRKRSSTIEPVFGQMSERGLNRFLFRGVENVRAEWKLWCATHNLLKLWRSGLGIAGVSDRIERKVRIVLETLEVFRVKVLTSVLGVRIDQPELFRAVA